MGKAKNIVFLVAKIILLILTALYVVFFCSLLISFIIDYMGGNGWAALGFVLLWVYLMIPALLLVIASGIFLILAICFKNYKRKILNIIIFTILTILLVPSRDAPRLMKSSAS